MKIPVIDLHSDYLYRLYANTYMHAQYSFQSSPQQVRAGGGIAQNYTVFLDDIVLPQALTASLQYMELLRREIAKQNGHWLKTRQDAAKLASDQWFALLSFEGCEPLQYHLELLPLFADLGLRMVALTWSRRNLLAHGIRNEGALIHVSEGISEQGLHLIEQCEQLGICLDVSHLGHKEFQQLAEHSSKPFLASHSNCYAVCAHPRNLLDEEIKTIADRGGIVGLNFVPKFLQEDPIESIDSWIAHWKHLMQIGGEDICAVGSDLDGMEYTPPFIASAEDYPHFWEAVSKAGISDRLLEKCAYQNAKRFFEENLPNEK